MTANKSEYTPKGKLSILTYAMTTVNIFWPPLISRTAFTLLGMEFTRASQVATGILFHSFMTTSRSWRIFETLCTSAFRLRIPQRCSIRFKSEDMFGPSINFTLSFFIKCRSFEESIWAWSSARALSFFGRPTRDLFWVDPVFLKRWMIFATVLLLIFRVLTIFFSLGHLHVAQQYVF